MKNFPPGPEQCHPRVGNVKPVSGCLPKSILKRISDTSNTSNQKTLIDNSSLNEDEKKYLIKTYLRPPQPNDWKNDPDKWLDSNDIENVMKQYEEVNSQFNFMGPFPIDFAAPDPYSKNNNKCLIQEICGLKVIESLTKGIKFIGIIYNLDPHFKDGSHWVANFINLSKPTHYCYYFDSYGYEPPAQIQKFMKWLTTQDPHMKLAYNARRFQFKGSECGMYSLYFIIRMLMGDNFRTFCRRAPNDSVMLKYRNWIFSN